MISASLTFPYDKLRERIVASFNADQRASGGQQELQIDAMTGRGLSGVRMTGVTLLGAPAEPGKPPSRLVVDAATIHFSLLSMLVGNSDVDFDLDLFGGEAREKWARRARRSRSISPSIRSISAKWGLSFSCSVFQSTGDSPAACIWSCRTEGLRRERETSLST